MFSLTPKKSVSEQSKENSVVNLVKTTNVENNAIKNWLVLENIVFKNHYKNV